MNTKAVLGVCVLGLALAGCAALRGMGFGSGCNDAVCHVRVTVNDCRVSVDPDPVYIARGEHKIKWKLQSTRHDFTSNGISFASGGGTVFKNPHRPGVGEFEVTDFNNATGRYKYTITVTQDGKPCPPHDPDVMND